MVVFCFVYNLSSGYQTINIPNLTYKITEKEKLKRESKHVKHGEGHS